MAIATYGDLKVSLKNWLNRTDSATINEIPNFINFAEKELYRNLRIPSFEGTAIVTLGTGAFNIPTDLLKFKHLLVPGMGILKATSLEGVFVESMSFARDTSFCYVSADIPAGTEIYVTYYRDQKELALDSDTNILLVVAPELLLYTAAKHGAIYAQDEEDIQKFSQLAQGAYQQIVEQAEALEYSGSALAIPVQSTI